jgi:hypothetical protein
MPPNDKVTVEIESSHLYVFFRHSFSPSFDGRLVSPSKYLRNELSGIFLILRQTLPHRACWSGSPELLWHRVEPWQPFSSPSFMVWWVKNLVAMATPAAISSYREHSLRFLSICVSLSISLLW